MSTTTIPALLIMIMATSSGGGTGNSLAYEFPSIEMCNESIKSGKFVMPNGNESEGYITIVCVPKEGGKWSGITYKDSSPITFPTED